MRGLRTRVRARLLALLVGAWAAPWTPAEAVVDPPATNAFAALPPPVFSPRAHRIRAVDADNHNIWFNRPGLISVIVGTDEDSQDAARDAGRAMYPFQGRPDFQLIVVVDLRDSIATWAPSIVISRMRSNLDDEAVALKPYFLKNGNRSNPRFASHVVPDFNGTICPLLGWKDSSGEDLRVVIFGVDGRELERFDKIDDMAKLQDEVRKAIQAQVDIEQDRIAAAARTPGSKLLHPVMQHPPIVPYAPFQKASSD